MSVQSQINRISGNISNAYSAVSSKGGTLPSSQTSANLSTAISSIPVGYPIDVATDAGMSAVLVDANVGKVYKFTGTTGTYVNGDLYVVNQSYVPVAHLYISSEQILFTLPAHSICLDSGVVTEMALDISTSIHDEVEREDYVVYDIGKVIYYNGGGLAVNPIFECSGEYTISGTPLNLEYFRLVLDSNELSIIIYPNEGEYYIRYTGKMGSSSGIIYTAEDTEITLNVM